MILHELLHRYVPADEYEAAMKARLEAFLAAAARQGGDPFGRELAGEAPAWGHVTGSAWVASEDYSRTLMVHHAKLGIWVQPGGHCDGEADAAAVARREAEEETGLAATLLSPEIFDIDAHTIPEYWRTPAHIHYDVRFLLRADAAQTPVVTAESHAVRWFTLEEAEQRSGEESIARMVRKTRRLRDAARGDSAPGDAVACGNEA